MREGHHLYQQINPSHGDSTSRNSAVTLLETAPTKIARVLVYLRHYGSLNRFEAARLVGDTCLNSTIPKLESYGGLTIDRQPEKSANQWGDPCECTRYRLSASAYNKADKAIGQMFARISKRQKVPA